MCMCACVRACLRAYHCMYLYGGVSACIAVVHSHVRRMYERIYVCMYGPYVRMYIGLHTQPSWFLKGFYTN